MDQRIFGTMKEKMIIERSFGITFYPVAKRTLRLIERGKWNFKSNVAMIKEPCAAIT